MYLHFTEISIISSSILFNTYFRMSITSITDNFILLFLCLFLFTHVYILKIKKNNNHKKIYFVALRFVRNRNSILII